MRHPGRDIDSKRVNWNRFRTLHWVYLFHRNKTSSRKENCKKHSFWSTSVIAATIIKNSISHPQSFNYSDYARRDSSAERGPWKRITDFQYRIEQYLDLANTSYHNYTADADAIHETNIMFLNRGRNYFGTKSNFYSVCIEYPERMLIEKIAAFDLKYKQFTDSYSSIYSKVISLDRKLDALLDTILKDIEEGRICFTNGCA